MSVLHVLTRISSANPPAYGNFQLYRGASSAAIAGTALTVMGSNLVLHWDRTGCKQEQEHNMNSFSKYAGSA